MPQAMKLPPPPADLGPCRVCRWWLASAITPAVKLPNGAIIPREVYDRASTLVAGALEFNQAPCTHSPQWVLQPGDGWCGQWSPIKHS